MSNKTGNMRSDTGMTGINSFNKTLTLQILFYKILYRKFVKQIQRNKIVFIYPRPSSSTVRATHIVKIKVRCTTYRDVCKTKVT